MGRIVLNHRPSRITIVDGFVLPPAEEPHTGAPLKPSRTKFTSAQMVKVEKCENTQLLFDAGILVLGEEVPDREPTDAAPHPPAADPVEDKKKK